MRRGAAATILVATLVAPWRTSVAAPVKKPGEPTLPAPSIKLNVTHGAPGAPWRLIVENTSDGPIRVPADPRLLTLELRPSAENTPKNKKAPALTCTLPDDARPATDEDAELVIPPSRSWSASFDPLFYCFGAKERAALVSGTTVNARFGWASKATKPAAPYVAVPVGASVGKVAPLKVIDADPFTLGDAVLKPEESTTPASGVYLTTPEAVDVARGVDLGTNVTLVNGGDRSLTLMFRPNMIEWAVSGPGGNVACPARTPASIIRELFSTVPVKGKVDTTVLVTVTCPAGTFDQPGIYRLAPKLDTTQVSGRALGVKTWEDIATARTPMLLRVRSPRKPVTLARAALD